MLLIGIIIANVPEGILPTVTLSLSMAANRMAAKNCLVHAIEAVETLGSTAVICTDKTGTLTENKMLLRHIWFDRSFVNVLSTSPDQYYTTKSWMKLIRVAVLCNRAEFSKDEESSEDIPIEERVITGDASEAAILRYAEMSLGYVDHRRECNKKVFEIPFSSVNKYQVSIHETEDPNEPRYLLVMKGAPEKIFDLCTTAYINGKEVPFDDELKEDCNKACLVLADLGERVMGFCDYLFPSADFPRGYEFTAEPVNFPLKGFRFTGLMSMLDPPRSAVPNAIAKCRSAGIKVTMVSGDHPVTSMAIARACGIFSEGTETVEDVAKRLGIAESEVDPMLAKRAVVLGSQLSTMTKEELKDLLTTKEEIVFARTSPQQKLSIVEAYQDLGSVVAVTGDGVNDAPALKKADIGKSLIV